MFYRTEGTDELYAAYRFTEPWDSPTNRTLADNLWGRIFTRQSAEGKYLTNYVVVVGDNTLWPAERVRSLREVPPDQEKIVVMEIPASDIHWMEPRDISVLGAVEVYQQYVGRRRGWLSRPLHCFTTHGRVIDLASIDSADAFIDMLLLEDCGD